MEVPTNKNAISAAWLILISSVLRLFYRKPFEKFTIVQALSMHDFPKNGCLCYRCAEEYTQYANDPP